MRHRADNFTLSYRPGKVRMQPDLQDCEPTPFACYLVGELTPIANVSVANNTLTNPRLNTISTTSFNNGNIPKHHNMACT